MKKRIIIILACLAILLIPSAVLAQDFPPPPPGSGIPIPPHQFYGVVTINGSIAPAGAVVIACLNGTHTPAAITQTNSIGRYGYDTNNLLYVGGNNGDLVTFFVNGYWAGQVIYETGGITQSYLYTVTTTGNPVSFSNASTPVTVVIPTPVITSEPIPTSVAPVTLNNIIKVYINGVFAASIPYTLSSGELRLDLKLQ